MYDDLSPANHKKLANNLVDNDKYSNNHSPAKKYNDSVNEPSDSFNINISMKSPEQNNRFNSESS